MSGRNYDLVFGDKFAIRAFDDTFNGSMESYLEFMEERIRQLHRVLKPTGSFYLHCDHHASHYLKVMCDRIFGMKNFRNEVIWHYTGGLNAKKNFPRKHDSIFLYSKSKNNIFNIIREPYAKGSGYAKGGITSKAGKKYNPNPNGKPIDNVWNIPIINPMSKERLGYPTQKPESLLERIIKASSNEGDIVLDAFCGCGTTLVAANKLNRKWVGIDVSPIGCDVMAKRIKVPLCNIEGMKYSLEQLKKMEWLNFQIWCCDAINGTALKTKGADGGIDGWQSKNKFKQSVPIEVKQHSIGRPDVQKFNTVLQREKKKGGFMIAFHISKPAITEAKRIKRELDRDIIFITVDDILSPDDKLTKLGATQLSAMLSI